MSIDRRTFLKSSTFAAAAAIAPDVSARPDSTETPKASFLSPVDCVNILQGTDSSPLFSRGNTLPIAARPFGMAHWTLQSKSDTSWFFAPHDKRLQGFRCTHQLSPWLGDYGQAIFLPCAGEVNAEPDARSSSWRLDQSVLHPYSLLVHLARYTITAELIPTERCAIIHALYEKGETPHFLIDLPGDHGPLITPAPDERVVRFKSTANKGGVHDDFGTYYVAHFSSQWNVDEVKPVKGHTLAMLTFPDDLQGLEVRIGTSFISYEQAEINLAQEVGAHSIDALRSEGRQSWETQLSTITFSGATDIQRRTFYSCLYRTLLFPRIWHELDASNGVVHRSPYNGQVVAGVMYADHGYWDVYRAWYPMMSLLFPERLAEILQAWVNVYKEGGWLPQFPCPGYRACMTGSLIDSVFGDAAAKGIPGFDLATAYEGLRKHAMQVGNPDAGYGRRGIAEYMRFGYCPADTVSQSAAETVDQAYGDFCIAQVAKALGKDDDYALLMKRSGNWRNLFDKTSGFFRGKKADGTWLEPFDPIRWGDPYVEGSAWQHRFDAPHDLPALFGLLGGKAKAVEALDAMLAHAPDFHVGSYGEEIHEMSEMAAVDFGQYAHSNQPVHHALYLYTIAGRSDRTRYWAHRVLNELYAPDTFGGDEDTGSMAAWYVFSVLGIFPVCPGKAEYALGHALFPSIEVKLPGGKLLIIKAAPEKTAQGKVTLDSQGLLDGIVLHKDLASGGTLHFI